MEKSHLKWIYLASFLILLAISILIISPFLISIFTGIIIAYFFYPAFRFVDKIIKKRWLSALLISVLIVLVFTAPLIATVDLFGRDAYVSYLLLKQKVSAGIVSNATCTEPGFKCSMVNYAANIIKNPQFNFYINDLLNKAANYVVQRTNEFIATLPKLFLDILIMLFVMYYIFKDGEIFVKKLGELIPLKERYKKKLLIRMDDMLKSTLYGSMLIAFIQGVTGAIGYYIFGLNSVMLLATATMMAAFIPVIGAITVWLPAALFLTIDGLIYNVNSQIFNGLGLMIYGTIVISTLDNLLKPKIIGDRAKMHPLIILLGIFGGLALFGIIGILLGPLVLAILITFVEIYQEERVRYEL